MKRIFTFLLALLLLSFEKTFSQFCVSLNCAASHTGLTADGTLPDRPGAELGGACYAGANYKQVFWGFFLSTGGNFGQTFTPTAPLNGLDLDYFVYDIGTTAPALTCPVDPTAWTIILCSNAGTNDVATGPGLDGVAATTAGDYYAVAIVSWQGTSNGGIASYTFDIGTPTLDAGGGPVALTGANCPAILLPVKLSSFNTRVNNCIVNLNWTSVNESDFKNYEVQYSHDGSNFNTIADIAAAGTNTDQKYSYQDINPKQGKVFYRLKMVDIDGHSEYSKTIAMRLDCSKAQLFAYPNPVKDILNVNITNSQSLTTAKLFDNNGKLIFTGKLISGTNTINMGNFAKGIYLLQLVNNEQVQNLKIIK